MKAIVGTCPCANSLDHLDFRLFNFGSHSQNQVKFTVSFFFKPEVHLPIFQGSASNFELRRILLIMWIVVMVHWQYFIIKPLFQEANFPPIKEGRRWNLRLC